jgi:hypothetical protein
MGVNYNPKIVADGLQLYLDAANPKSYPGSGTTWTDLSGNENNATLVNGVSYSSDNLGMLSGNTTNRYINISNDGLGDSFSSFTLELIARTRTGAGSDGYGYLYHRGVSQLVGSACMYFTMRTNSLVFSVNTNNNERTINANANNVLGIYSVTWNGSTVKIYSSGEEVDSYSFSTFTASRTNNFFNLLGSSVNPTYRPGNHDIFSFKVYNKALTESEIKQNFNALRGRYGI